MNLGKFWFLSDSESEDSVCSLLVGLVLVAIYFGGLVSAPLLPTHLGVRYWEVPFFEGGTHSPRQIRATGVVYLTSDRLSSTYILFSFTVPIHYVERLEVHSNVETCCQKLIDPPATAF